jgi:hypothetical protein
MGTKMLVYTDGNASQAQTLARQLADEVIGMKDALTVNYPPIDEALDQALAFESGPVIIADGADNPGGGAASDSTFVLQRMIERGVTNAAHRPSVGSDRGAHRLRCRRGRPPADAHWRQDQPAFGPAAGPGLHGQGAQAGHDHDRLAGSPTQMGDSALVEADGIEIVLITLRNQAMGTDMFTARLRPGRQEIDRGQVFAALLRLFLQSGKARDLCRRARLRDAGPEHPSLQEDPAPQASGLHRWLIRSTSLPVSL